MNKPDRAFEANQKLWDELARLHFDSKTYKTKEFLEGSIVLHPIELQELGEVKGKTLLHLQCQFGLDTLSWARKGATVTGVDFSGASIQLARRLSRQTRLKAKFIQSNIYDLPNALHEEFDIVFTSYGVLCWLPDLRKWAEIISRFLKSKGVFYIAEFHPLMWVFDWDSPDGFRMKRSYF
ncbi:MAG: SAM-dependent methyltransferase, partial [Candidatus Thorarchaeota archaeon]